MCYANDDWSTVIYISGEKRRATNLGSRFWVDSDSLPRRRCSQHGLSALATLHLMSGGRVRTSGNWYSLSPDKETS